LFGFSEGESCFCISIYESKKSKLGLAVQLVFKITQHSRDMELLKSISNYLGCGRVEKRKSKACDFTVTSFKSFEEKILPFFSENPLYGLKSLELEAFKKAFLIIKNKEHLEVQGLEELKNIKDYMNTKRNK
jgi:LAGLIDADG endonuclease